MGTVQARYSALTTSATPLIAGYPNVFRIQAKDIYSNVVINTNEFFQFQIKNLATSSHLNANITYVFQLYEASFSLTLAGSYSSIIRLIQHGGLTAYYYRYVDFENSVNLLSNYNHTNSYYTQVDAALDFEDIGYDALLTSVAYPSQYFSVRWDGYLRAPTTETYRLSIDVFNTSLV